MVVRVIRGKNNLGCSAIRIGHLIGPLFYADISKSDIGYTLFFKTKNGESHYYNLRSPIIKLVK